MTVVDLFCLMEPSGRSCTTRLTLSAAGGGEESAAGQDQATHEGPEAQSRLSRSRVNECIAAAFLSTFGGRCQGREGKDQARLLNTKHPLQRSFFIGVGYGQNEIKNLELEILCSSILPSRFYSWVLWLSAGFYFVPIAGSDGSWTEKLMVVDGAHLSPDSCLLHAV